MYINYLTIKFLVEEKGFDVNAKDTYGQSLLMRYGDANLSIAICRALIQNGADIDAVDDSGETVLHKAARRNNLGMCRLLLEFGAAVNTGCNHGWTPLHEICLAFNRDVTLIIIKLLISKGVEVNAQIDDGRTVLDLLLDRQYEGYKEIEKYLRRYGGKKSEEM